ncbi:type I-E CRISPR-associated protein Cas6/Cse3/CasE [Acidipropionibacterium jensenii]|uniref:type I-E CRISPR-associated protein Cas6/Cse3/CasE n=1 Tax=Acidipropionibacterium jensenii TaxID=1749 RepID=UPI000BC2D788|nr:type I-E CRISPR-associated protein Cas6/Cse3/CasE [Acidipropionibacterium jensenii]AZZ41144.1 type I-E CRISPR-associated protein Cas6/Cse3/CasE [Acidipropionibacterium jensenii]
MAYLSSIPINPLRRGGQRLLSNRQRMHAALLGGMAVQPVKEKILWRLEAAEHSSRVLVLTASRPNWDHIVEQAGWPGADGSDPKMADYSPLLAMVVRGRRFTFRTTLNTVSSSHNPESATATQKKHLTAPSRRAVHLGERSAPNQLLWFLKRAADEHDQWGFTVGRSESPTVRIIERSHERFTRRRGEPPVSLNLATFEGELQVTDPELMTRSLLEGIGKAKAYGCGLITLAATGGSDVVVG